MAKKLSEKQLDALRVAAERKEVRVIDDFPAGTLRSLAQRGLMQAEHRPERGGYWWYYSITDAGRAALAAQTANQITVREAYDTETPTRYNGVAVKSIRNKSAWMYVLTLESGEEVTLRDFVLLDTIAPANQVTDADNMVEATDNVFANSEPVVEAPQTTPVCACCVVNAATEGGLCDHCGAFVRGLKASHDLKVGDLEAKLDARIEILNRVYAERDNARDDAAGLREENAALKAEVERLRNALENVYIEADKPSSASLNMHNAQQIALKALSS